jgi:putative ABC transport system ATP-binding protein
MYAVTPGGTERTSKAQENPAMTITTVSPKQATSTVGAHGSAARTEGVSKLYGTGDATVAALDDVTVGLDRGRFTAIMGPSGSGKSTLLHMLAGLDRPTSGEVYLGDTEITRLGDKALTLLRRDRIGFIFQSFNLLPTMTAAENIVLPMRIAGRKPDKQWVASIVETVGLGGRLDHRPTQLSGGQQQRVAAARALASKPEIVFADEPTGALDSRSGTELLTFLRTAVDELGQTVVMVTHDPTAASYADRVLFLADGHIVAEAQQPTAEEVLDYMKNLGA